MSAYKYMTVSGALRYLSTWALRVTPPFEFNDPFEMRSTVELLSEEVVSRYFDSALPDLPQQLATEFCSQFGTAVPIERVMQLVTELFGDMTIEQEAGFAQRVIESFPGLPVEMFVNLRMKFRSAYREQLHVAKREFSSIMPALNASIQTQMHDFFSTKVGVLCLSNSATHPLMWAHYGDSHRGVMLEFDDRANCFSRRRNSEDEFGYFRRVTYVDRRPRLTYDASEDAIVTIALTKALEWAYEQEVRFLWPLAHADRVVGDTHLIACPPAALRSVTLGCRSMSQSAKLLLDALDACTEASHVRLRKARLHGEAFALVYDWQPRLGEL